MKILYFTQVEDISKTSGVLQKILANIKSLNKLGVFTLGLTYSSMINRETFIGNHYKILPYKSSKLKFFSSSINEYRKLELFTVYLEENAHKFDLILIRYVLGDSGLLNIVKTYGDKLIIEHNTKELEQLKVFGTEKWKSFTSNFRPGYLLTYLESYLFRFIKEKYFGNKIRKNSAFGFAVTKEIAIYEEKRAKGYKCFVVSNSIDIIKTSRKKSNAYELNIIILIGYNAPWHGIDRVLEGLLLYKGDEKIEVNLVGEIGDSEKDYIKSHKLDRLVKFHSASHGLELEELINKSNIGIGSLSIYRKGLTEASPLKTRGYLARGLPVVVGYHDTDLEKHEEFKPYFLRVHADDSPLDFEEIIDFYHRAYQIPDVNTKIRELAVRYLNTEVKMKELISIIENYQD